jgi:hypothetical protein
MAPGRTRPSCGRARGARVRCPSARQTAVGRCIRAVVLLVAASLLAACASQDFDGPDGDRRFYEARCSVCHVPRPREQFTPGEWQRILDVMAPRAGLTGAQRDRVSAYLTAR